MFASRLGIILIMFLLVDKPEGISSHGVVNKLRGITGERRIGHAGTLDPFASGLLVLGIGRESTKRLGEFLDMDKMYTAEIVLGEARDTDDLTGKVISKSERLGIDVGEVKKCLKKFEGEVFQMPPIYSAKKVGGKKSYQEARKGNTLSLKEKKVSIYTAKVLNFRYPDLKIKCRVSSGTYIRALGRDIGKCLGVGGYLKGLRRISVGRFETDSAVSLDTLTKDNWKEYTFDI